MGEIPKTAWVMDYPIFERIYYNLVAGFNIYGNVSHQVATRLYMDHLRMQSENLFLGLPARGPARGDPRLVVRRRHAQPLLRGRRTACARSITARRSDYKTSDPKAELLEMMIAQAGPAAGPPDLLNRCAKPPCDRPDASARRARRRARAPAHRLGQGRLRAAAAGGRLPARARRPGNAQGENDLVYALVHNDAHTNVAFMFDEDKRRLPADDTLSVRARTLRQLPELLLRGGRRRRSPRSSASMLALRSDADLERFVASYGIRRTSARFWETADWLHADLKRREPTEAGLYDFDRYENL